MLLALRPYFFLLFSLTLMVPISLQAHAKKQFGTHHEYGTLYAAAKISKQQAAKIAQQYVTGRILKVSSDGNVYRVKIISQSGDVVSVFINANTGQIINQ